MHDVTIKGKGREGSARCSCGWQSRAGWSRRYASLMARLHRGAAPMSPDTSQPQTGAEKARLDALLALSADDLMGLIHQHLKDREFEAVVALLHLLAVKDPDSAEAILLTVQAVARV